MFRLKIPRTHFNFGFQICRNYLSHEYKKTLVDFDVHALEANNVQAKGYPAQGIILLDIVNGIAQDNRNNAFSESLLKLRSSPDKATQFDATNYAIFRNFLDHENVDELLPIIKDRLQSGVFIDNFVGCYIVNQLLQENNFTGATEVSLEIFKQDSLNNKLVVGLILKSIVEYLKQNIEQIFPPVVKEKKTGKKSDEKRVRVKFVRNSEGTSQLPGDIGKALCRISELYPNELMENLKLLGAFLDNRHNLATSLLNNKEIIFCRQTLELSQTLLKNKEGVDDLTNGITLRLEEAVDTKNIDNLLSRFFEEIGKGDEIKLIEQQKAKYEIWKEQDAIEKNKKINVIPPSQRKENIDQILSDLTQKRQKLWYFENEELIDLEIFKKNKSYPKRWFGKKKKPKVVDDDYVPPEITRKS